MESCGTASQSSYVYSWFVKTFNCITANSANKPNKSCFVRQAASSSHFLSQENQDWGARQSGKFLRLSSTCVTVCLSCPSSMGGGGEKRGTSYNEKRWAHMVAVLRSCMWQITFSTNDSDHSGDFKKERVSRGATYHLESSELWHIQFTSTCGPVSNLSVKLTRPTAREIGCGLTWQGTLLGQVKKQKKKKKRARFWD